MMNLNKYIDHTLLKADATFEDIERLCEQAKMYQFASVCINPFYVKQAKELLQGSEVRVCTVVSFPLGANALYAKINEAIDVVSNGADEVDMVINIAALKNQQYDIVEDEIRMIKKVCDEKILKVILETCLLTKKEIVKACQIAQKGNADFVKTSTGFSISGATVEDVKLMKASISSSMQVKASGGIKTYADALKMIEAGATRLGTSNGINIIGQQQSVTNEY